VVTLWSTSITKGYACPIWLTFKQAIELGRNIRKGEKGELVVSADKITRCETDTKGEQVEHFIPFMKGYSVFNAEQHEKVPAQYTAKTEPSMLTPMQCLESAGGAP
jgi:antirestriction protein ArdC